MEWVLGDELRRDAPLFSKTYILFVCACFRALWRDLLILLVTFALLTLMKKWRVGLVLGEVLQKNMMLFFDIDAFCFWFCFRALRRV